MHSPEERKAATLKKLTAFLREGKYLQWSYEDVKAIEQAIETAYDAGKNSIDEVITETIKNVNYSIENGGYGTYKKR